MRSCTGVRAGGKDKLQKQIVVLVVRSRQQMRWRPLRGSHRWAKVVNEKHVVFLPVNVEDME
jgi:hypothetical protein